MQKRRKGESYPRLSGLDNLFSRKRSFIAFVLVFGLIGGYTLLFSHAATLTGDINGDGRVDGSDLTILLANYGTSYSPADLNKDGSVDVFDLSILLSHFGESAALTPTVTITATPSTISSGQSSTLSWSSTNATACSASWTTSTATNGSQSVSPTQTTTYSMTCNGAGGSSSGSATVTVNSSTNSGVLYTIGGSCNGHNGCIRAWDEGSWTLSGSWNIPALENGGQNSSVRGTAYDGGYLYIAAGGDQASGSNGSGQVIKWDLVHNSQAYAVAGSFGYDQLAACNGYIYEPTGEGSTGTTWEVLSEASGSVVGTINGPTGGPHNTICTTVSGTTHVYLGGRCYNGNCASSNLGQATCTAGSPCTSDNGLNVGPGLGSGGIRPFTVGRGLTRVWETWSFFRGFSIADLTTGKILSTVNFGSYSGSSTTPSHGISVDPANKEVYVLDSPNNQIRVYSSADSPSLLATINLTTFWGGSENSPYCTYDCSKVGWVQHSYDGHYVFVGDSGDIIDTSSRTLVVSGSNGPAQLHTDLFNIRHGYIDVEWSNGAPVKGNHFGLGN